MIDNIDNRITVFNKKDPRGRGIKTSASPKGLYKVDEDCENISPNKAKMFHILMSKTLYTTKRAGSDTFTAVDYLTTRVRNPNKYDWGKLLHIMD